MIVITESGLLSDQFP